jgi:hypothetical protein
MPTTTQATSASTPTTSTILKISARPRRMAPSRVAQRYGTDVLRDNRLVATRNQPPPGPVVTGSEEPQVRR